MVLQEHDWNVEDALQVLQMFSDAGTNTTAGHLFTMCNIYIFLIFCGTA